MVEGPRGRQGATGARGPTNRLAVVGYLIMAVAVCLAFAFTWAQEREVDEARRERLAQLNVVNTSQCKSLQNLYSVIRKTLEDSDKAIDELTYYQLHPIEAAQAHSRNQATLRLFATPPCPDKFTIPEE